MRAEIKKIGLALFLLTTRADCVPLDAAAYGMIPNDGRDDTVGFRKILADAQTRPNSVITLAHGQYDFASAPSQRSRPSVPIATVNEARGITLKGDGTLFVVHDFRPLIGFVQCSDVVIEGLTVDWDPPPFADARIISVTHEAVMLALQEPNPALESAHIEGWLPWDVTAGRPRSDKRERYWLRSDGPKLQRIDDLHYRMIRKDYSDPFTPNELSQKDAVVLRIRIYGCNAFSFFSCRRTTLRNSTVLTTPGMAVVGSFSTDISVDNLTVMPKEGRWMSTGADAMHFIGCRGRISICGSRFYQMGDDALNVQANLSRVDKIIKPSTIILSPGRPNQEQPKLPLTDDSIGLAPPDRPLDFGFCGRAIASWVEDPKRRTIAIKLSASIPKSISVGSTYSDLSDAPIVNVENVTVANNRARGFLLQTTGPICVLNCQFSYQSGPAIELTSDVRDWWEGPGVRDVKITGCTFTGGNDGPGQHEGLIAIFSDEPGGYAAYPVHRGIRITNNQFRGVTQPPIFVRSAENITDLNNETYAE